MSFSMLQILWAAGPLSYRISFWKFFILLQNGHMHLVILLLQNMSVTVGPDSSEFSCCSKTR